ncbi:hypothetical protein TARUN_9432 [Trichoderma arundinaceum]|uniref:Uncharacterized protein n=1 Tax=Trichoderma arundinaceum TaxID=490622 RepID=A0A395N9L8_TRIAR|nr:hypothetical protein TARUN_9432 [Trichoderma arundinaceum]
MEPVSGFAPSAASLGTVESQVRGTSRHEAPSTLGTRACKPSSSAASVPPGPLAATLHLSPEAAPKGAPGAGAASRRRAAEHQARETSREGTSLFLVAPAAHARRRPTTAPASWPKPAVGVLHNSRPERRPGRGPPRPLAACASTAPTGALERCARPLQQAFSLARGLHGGRQARPRHLALAPGAGTIGAASTVKTTPRSPCARLADACEIPGRLHGASSLAQYRPLGSWVSSGKI